MEFGEFNTLLQNNFNKMVEGESKLFETNVDKDMLWDLYLDSFPEGTNEIFRERREYDCNCCRQFIRSFGNVVSIKDNMVQTIWDFETNDSTFQPVIDALSKYVKSKEISSVYIGKSNKIGTKSNKEITGSGLIYTWEHLYLEIPDAFVSNIHDIGEKKNRYNTLKYVFKRSLDELTEDSVLTVLELISQSSLYKGEEWKSTLETFLNCIREHNNLETKIEKENYAWNNISFISGIRNTSIGTLLVDISNGEDLEVAIGKYEKIVAPENYKRSKPIYTQKMLEDFKKTIQEQGYMDSLARRYATLDDITVNDILFSNKDTEKRMIKHDVFDEMLSEVSVNPKKFSRVEEVSVSDFIENILPTSKEIEVLVESKHTKNMASLIAPENKDSKTMFKWDNSFSWAYTGNITDSSMKENVKNAGGKVDGVLRFSIQWNDDENDYNPNDFDAHCIEPSGNHIYYGGKRGHRSTGELDVDIINPVRRQVAVENITWSTKSRMDKGKYVFYVHNFTHNGGRSGFKAEIEFDGQIYSFEYDKELRQGERVDVAIVTCDATGFSIQEKLPSSTSTKEVWGIKTNQFVPVSAICYSPNYWGDNATGNKHYLFMLKGCRNIESPNGIFNEYLNQNLYAYKRVVEALASKMRVEDSENQMSGLGFSSTRRNDLLVKVKSDTEKIVRVKF